MTKTASVTAAASQRVRYGENGQVSERSRSLPSGNGDLGIHPDERFTNRRVKVEEIV